MRYERIIENIKVPLRKNKAIYYFARLLYSPFFVLSSIKHFWQFSHKSKNILNELLSMKPMDKRVFYMAVPVHENLGDAAQMYCIRRWIHQYYPYYDLFEIESEPTNSKKVRSQLEKVIAKENIIIVESGATFSDKHIDHTMHRYLLETFKENKLVFMPNTVNIFDEKEMIKTSTLFNAHPKALFLARDPESFRMISPYFDNKRIRLFPDIVTSLIGNINFDEKRDGILVCKRIDGEKLYSDSDSKSMIQKLKALDSVDLTDTDFENDIEYTYSHLEEVIMNKIKLFSKYKVVLTDRYHGMIFSLIANTPVVVLATVGHKVREGAQWFKQDYPNSIWFCETPDDAYLQVKQLINQNIRCDNKSIYKEQYFDKLKEIFDQTL